MTSREDERWRGQEEFFLYYKDQENLRIDDEKVEENQEMRRKRRDQKSKAKQITQGKCKGK
jgi:hypothetical protein